MPRVLLITNPAASRTDPAVVRTVCGVWAREGWAVDVAGTTRPGHAGELARQAVADGIDVVAVYGGDGTTMQAVSGLVGFDVRVGLIPGGTGNLLAGNLRIPRDPARAALAIVRGTDRRIDLGRVTRGEEVRYFAVNCGAGFAADLMLATSGPSKRRWGMGAYVLQMWETIGAAPHVGHRLTVDDTVIEVEATSVLVLNCGEVIPPFLRLGHAVAVDDGWLDIVIFGWSGLLDSVGVLWNVLAGGPDGGDGVRYAKCRRVVVETAVARPVQLDGDPTGTTPFAAEVMPAAIAVMVPAPR